MNVTLLDCTLRDGGYYNQWDYEPALVDAYLAAMAALGTDYVELGFRSFDTRGFKGGCAYTTDAYLDTLTIPPSLQVGVMVNGAELISHAGGPVAAIDALFRDASQSRVTLVRLACHLHEFKPCLEAIARLRALGYRTGINLMQIADRHPDEIAGVARSAAASAVEVLYFADSMGSLNPEQTARIVRDIRREWSGPIGIHTHDNLGLALANTLRAAEEGVTWLDATVTGMGRGPGNVKTEYLAIELIARTPDRRRDLTPLLALIRRYFKPLQQQYEWGTNPYYYLAGKHGIHPTYIQEMLSDPRFAEEDILSVIGRLEQADGKKFSSTRLETGRIACTGPRQGQWAPSTLLSGREVLIVAPGASVARHRTAIEHWIRARRPRVIALNTVDIIDGALIDLRAASHPIRLTADHPRYRQLGQPLVAPLSMLPCDLRSRLSGLDINDFGQAVESGRFAFDATSCVTPNVLVAGYALAIATSGGAARIDLAGFDGFAADDPRQDEMTATLDAYLRTPGALPLRTITPSRHARLTATSVYALNA